MFIPRLGCGRYAYSRYVCSGGTASIYAFDQELHSTVRARMRRYDEREGRFLLGKGHARPHGVANIVNRLW
jgi:hypothetical protein